MGFLGLYWVLLGLVGFDLILLGFTGNNWVFLGYTGFCWVWLGYTELGWVILGLTRFYWVLLVITEFSWAILGFAGFGWVLLGLVGLYWVWLDFTGYNWVFLGYTWVTLDLIGFPSVSPFALLRRGHKKKGHKNFGLRRRLFKDDFQWSSFRFCSYCCSKKNKKRKEKEIDERRGRWSRFGPCEKKSANHVLLFSIFLVLRRLQMESVSQWTRSIKDAVSNVVVVVVVRFLFLFFSFFFGGGGGGATSAIVSDDEPIDFGALLKKKNCSLSTWLGNQRPFVTRDGHKSRAVISRAPTFFRRRRRYRRR